MILTLTFLLTFTAGPAMFWVLARQQPTKRYFLLLWCIAIVLVAGAFYIARIAADPSQYTGLAAIMALWFAWIIVLVLCVLAVQRRTASEWVTRFAFAVGAMATTLPWFGLVVAQMVAR